MQSETLQLLDEQRVRDQLSAAEELAYLGHEEPAVVAAGAALEGALRFSTGGPPGTDVASILAELRVAHALDAAEHDAISALLAARDCLVHGWQPKGHPLHVRRTLDVAFGVVARLLEPTSEPAQRSATG